jgi:SAM-dependent methyltransferase
MPSHDPLGTLHRRPLLLELGSGGSKRDPRAVGVDLLDLPGVDVVGDVYDVLASLPDGSVDQITSEHFLEHIPDLERLLRESARVLRPGGRFLAQTPHFSSPYFYSDPTHRVHFGLYTLGYYVADTPMRRKVPQYAAPLPFVHGRPRYAFKSPRPFYARFVLKRVLGSFFNATGWLQEFYEENLCWLFPCYEIHYELVRA